MDAAQQKSLWPLVVTGVMIFLTVAAFYYVYIVMLAVAPACMSGNATTCRDFVPWMWAGIGLGVISVVLLAIAIFIRRDFRSILIPVGVAAVLTAVAFVGWRWLSPSSVAPASTATTESNSRAELLERMQGVQNAPDVGPTKALGKNPFPELPRSRVDLPLNDDPFLATSKEEQSWLDRNGYPNAKQWEAYGQASDSLLAQAAAAGDKSAKIMLDQRQLMAGDDTKIEALLTEGAKGSAFALDMLAAYLANGDAGGRVTAYAVSRVSEMRGNLRLGPARDAMFNEPLSPSDRMEGEKEAFEIYNSLYELQKSIAGPSSKPVDPRPVGG